MYKAFIVFHNVLDMEKPCPLKSPVQTFPYSIYIKISAENGKHVKSKLAAHRGKNINFTRIFGDRIVSSLDRCFDSQNIKN
jgi:hypothetical protein